MGSEVTAVVKDIAVILLVVSATVLCVSITVGLIKLFPSIRDAIHHLASTARSASKISSDFAEVSANVATNLDRGTASIASASGNICSISKDVADFTPLLRLLGPAGKAGSITCSDTALPIPSLPSPS